MIEVDINNREYREDYRKQSYSRHDAGKYPSFAIFLQGDKCPLNQSANLSNARLKVDHTIYHHEKARYYSSCSGPTALREPLERRITRPMTRTVGHSLGGCRREIY